MLKQTRGVILNTASMVGLIGQSSHAAYTATKGGDDRPDKVHGP